MTDNRFLRDVDTMLNKYQGEYGETLRKNLAGLIERGINSYAALFSLLRDVDSDTETLMNVCKVLYPLSYHADQRRVSWALQAMLKRNSAILRQMPYIIIALKSRYSIPFLMALAANKDESNRVRTFAIQALSSINDERPIPLLKELALNSENLEVRCEAIQQLSWYFDLHLIPAYISFLSDEAADVRFWAAYGLQILEMRCDISAALSELDRIAAFDHTVPMYWGWHLDREALQALESIYARHLLGHSDETFGLKIHLISPMPEYDTFINEYREYQDDSTYETLPSPTPSLNINPTWLAEKLRAQYPDIELDVRQPKPQTYLLDWRLTINESKLIGGLHRDGYGVVLRGDVHAAVYAFAAWYRGVISLEHKLYLYEWADSGVELVPNVTTKGVGDAVEAMQAMQQQAAMSKIT